jgi:hypothetical protein
LEQPAKQPAKQPSKQPAKQPAIQSKFVAATYEEQWFLAELSKNQSDVATGYTRLNWGFNSFGWGDKEDIHITLNEDILMSVIPQLVNSRGNLGLSDQDLRKVLRLMVVVYLTRTFVNFFILKVNWLLPVL